MKVVEIDPAVWSYGNGGLLYCSIKGTYCAVGFLLKSVGIPDEHMRDRSSTLTAKKAGADPTIVNQFIDCDPDYPKSKDWIWSIINVNDAPHLTIDERLKLFNKVANPYGFQFVLKEQSND